LFLLFAQDIAHADGGYTAPRRVNVPGFIVGRFSGDPHWPVLVIPEGQSQAQFAATMASVNNATSTIREEILFYLAFSPGLGGFDMAVIRVGKYPAKIQKRKRLSTKQHFGEEMQKLQPRIRSGTLDPLVAIV